MYGSNTENRNMAKELPYNEAATSLNASENKADGKLQLDWLG